METGWEPAGRTWPHRLWRPLPLVVDLDGALMARDPVREVLGATMRRRPGAAAAALWRHRRRPDLAARDMALRFPGDPVAVRVNGEVLDLIAAHRRCGGAVTLIGAAPMEMVEGIADALGLAGAAYGADRRQRFTPDRRALAAVSLFGRQGFDFAGGRPDQAPLCFAARRSLVVGGDDGLSGALRTAGGTMVRLARPDWRVIELSLGDLCAAPGRNRGLRMLNRSLSAAIWAGPEVPVAPVADFGAWQAGPETGDDRGAVPPERAARRGTGRAG